MRTFVENKRLKNIYRLKIDMKIVQCASRLNSFVGFVSNNCIIALVLLHFMCVFFKKLPFHILQQRSDILNSLVYCSFRSHTQSYVVWKQLW